MSQQNKRRHMSNCLFLCIFSIRARCSLRKTNKKVTCKSLHFLYRTLLFSTLAVSCWLWVLQYFEFPFKFPEQFSVACIFIILRWVESFFNFKSMMNQEGIVKDSKLIARNVSLTNLTDSIKTILKTKGKDSSKSMTPCQIKLIGKHGLLTLPLQGKDTKKEGGNWSTNRCLQEIQWKQFPLNNVG